MSNNPVTEFLQRRRSVVAKKMLPAAPAREHLEAILACAIRVPDHSNVQPWNIVVIDGDARRKFDEEVILPAAQKRAEELNDSPGEAILQAERTRMQRSGTVIAVLFKPVLPHKIPLWEQQLSCGAVCSHILIAAQSYGYAAQWLTEALGADPDSDQVAGFIHIGAMQQPPTERKRPRPEDIISYWQ
jgi:nitroreductase